MCICMNRKKKNPKLERSILKQVNYELQQLYLKNEYYFIGNSSINNTVRMIHLCKNGLYLNNYGKDELANNLVDNIDSFLQENIFQISNFWIDSV